MPIPRLGPAGRAMAIGLAFAAPATALLLGCGESDEERYGDALTAIARPLQAELIDLGNAIGSANTRKQVSAALGRADEALRSATGGLERLDPPAAGAEAQADLLAAIDDFEVRIARTRAVLRDGSDREVGRAMQAFNAASQSFAATLGEIGRRLEDAGIPLGEPATSGTP